MITASQRMSSRYWIASRSSSALCLPSADQLTPLLFRHPRGVKQQLAKVDPMVQGVCHHQPQGLGAFGRQVSRQQIGAIPALFDGLKHAVFRLG